MKMLVIVCLCALWSVVSSYEKDMTFTVAAGRTDCFYHDVAAGEVIDIEYQVIDSTHGELEISFQLAAPDGRVLVADYRKPEDSHRELAAMPGAYRVCFDNSFSTFSTKTVFFDLLIQSEEEVSRDYDGEEDKEMELGGGGGAGGASEAYMMRVRDIADSVTRVGHHVTAARRLQDAHAAHEARDRNRAENLCASVLRRALWQVAAMLLVGATQVIFVKSLFDENNSSKLSRVLSRLLR